MSIRLNQKVIAGNYERRPVSYRYVGEIFQSAIPITDKKVACLDGKKIYSGEGYDNFIQYLTSQSLLYPQLVCTEEIWQEKVEQYGSWGQFVINTDENSVRLPKIASFVQGLNTLEDLASLLEAGLPNIEGKFWDLLSSYGVSSHNATTMGDANGAFYTKAFEGINDSATITANGLKLSSDDGIGFDASLSSPIYGKSTTVQPQAIQYPYYIVLATGVVQEINIKDEVHLNNPFFFGMYQYFETNPNNVSWLKSEGQWNNGGVYESFYEWLVNSYNDTESGVSVKLNYDTYTNFDYVLNQNDKTFRLPIEVKQKFYNDISGNIPVAGNGMALGLTDGGKNYSLINYGYLTTSTDIGLSVGTISSFTSPINNALVGITDDPTKSGIEAQITQTEVEGLGLYFYVGETIQNVNIINTSKLIEEVEGVNNKYKSQITNCITEIPQRIKTELKDGVLTLKAGSQVIVPNGFEADGTTPKFDYITIESDLTYGSSGATGITYEYFLFYNITTKALSVRICSSCVSGTTAPNYTTYLGWYDTNENKIKNSNNSGSTWDTYLSLPVAQMSAVDGTWTKINQVFNGIGYIGSTVWVDKGVKCLIPNGRNEDGILNNNEVAINKLSTVSVNDTRNAYIVIGSLGIAIPTTTEWRYDEQNNYNIQNGSPKQWATVGNMSMQTGVITSFSVKQPFRALDYNNKSEISGWAMPSNKYIDLTLGASGTSYTAPANGWVFARTKAGSNKSFLQINNSTTALQSFSNMYTVGARASGILPVQKGQVFSFGYETGDTVEFFRFIYAQGEV